MIIDISKLDKAAVLAALYNHARPQGLGYLQATDERMTHERAQELLKKRTYFDYIQGRSCKIDLSGDELDPYLYDRDNGYGAAQRVIDGLLASKE